MGRNTLLVTAVTSLLLVCLVVGSTSGGTRQITLAERRDQIDGGWAGQIIGVSFGAPWLAASLALGQGERISPSRT